jgi:hypothetical protein
MYQHSSKPAIDFKLDRILEKDAQQGGWPHCQLKRESSYILIGKMMKYTCLPQKKIAGPVKSTCV